MAKKTGQRLVGDVGAKDFNGVVMGVRGGFAYAECWCGFVSIVYGEGVNKVV